MIKASNVNDSPMGVANGTRYLTITEDQSFERHSGIAVPGRINRDIRGILAEDSCILSILEGKSG